jgi:hypothetical protein
MAESQEARRIAEHWKTDGPHRVKHEWSRTLARAYLKLLTEQDELRERISVLEADPDYLLAAEVDGLRDAVAEARHLLQPRDGSYPTRAATIEALRVLIAIRQAPPVEAATDEGER